ncbi:MAG: hypothetical protein AABY30_04385 [Candidatus Thermoplasmatota archaeon]
MGSGFLRDIALRKQLEEKVKEATKTRQLAEQEVNAAKALIDGARAIDGDVAEAEADLAEAISLMSGKDYRSALEKAAEAKERGKRAYADRSRHFLDSTKSLLTVTKGMGVEDKDGLQALDKAEEAFAKEEYESSIDLAKKAWKKSEKVIHEHLSSSFSTAQSLIMTAKNMGKDAASAEDLLSRARSAVEGNDYEGALSFTRECLDIVSGELNAEVDRAMGDAQTALKTVQEFGGDAANVARLIERAKADLGKNDYDKAFNSLRQARQEGERALGKGLESRTSEFAKMLSDAEGIGADVTQARTLFKTFEKALKEGKLADATAVAREAYQLLQKSQFDRVLITISASRDKFVTARNIGADITPAIEHLNRARAAMQAGQFQEALAASKRADELVDQIVREYQNVEEEIRSMQRSFADAEVLGVDTSGAKRYMERARSMLENRDFRAAVDTLRRSREELERAQSERAMEVIERAEFLLTSGEKMGANLEESSRLLEDAVTGAKGKNFARAMEFATRSREVTERAVQRSLSESIAGLESSMQFLGEDASSVRTLLERAESALSARDFETAYGYLEEAMRLAEGKTKDRALQFHDVLRGAIQIGIELGVDVAALEGSLKAVNAAVDRGRYAEVVGFKERAMREVGVAADNLFNLVKAKVVEAKNLNIDITEMRDLLKRAKMALGVEDYTEALGLLRDCNAVANKTVGLHKQVYNAISSAAALVAEAKKRNVNVTKVLEMLLEAKRAHERFDHERALELAHRAKAETEKLMILYTSAQKIIAAREMLDLVGKAGVDAPHLKELLDEAKQAMKNKEYDRALEASERGEREVRELMQERVQSLLSASEALIGSLENMNLLAQEEKIMRAREALNRGDFVAGLDLATVIREEIESLKKKSEEASVAVGRATDLVMELEAMNVDPRVVQPTIKKAEQAVRESRFDDAVALAAQAVEEMERHRQEGIEGMMTRFEESIQKAKRENVDTRSAEKLIARAREFLQEKKYRQALALAMQAEGEAEKVGLQQDMAAKAIGTAEKKLGGFEAPMPELQRMLGEAKRALEDGDYVRALDIAIKTGEEFNHAREKFEEALEVGRRAQKLLGVVTSLGVDTASVAAPFEQAKAAVGVGKPEAARDAYQASLDEALRLVRSTVDARLAEGREGAEVAKRLGADPAVAWKKFSEARAQLDAEDYEGATRLIREGAESAREVAAKVAEEAVLAAQSKIEHSRRLGGDTMKAGETLGKARAEMQAGNFEQAVELAKSTQGLIQMRLDSEKQFADKSFQAESVIRRARKFGVEVGEAERLLAQAIQTKKADLDEAMKLALEAQAAAHTAIESFSPDVTAALEVKEPVVGEWVEATLTLTNSARAVAKDVKVKILGDAEVEGLKDLPAIRAKGVESLPIRVRMMAAGSIPLAIQITSARLLDGKEYHKEVIATVQVVTRGGVNGRTITYKVVDDGNVCKGLIKVGFTIKRCPHCGRDMHELCSARSPKCLACGQTLAAEGAKRKKISFRVG